MVLQCKAIELGKEYNAPIEHRINKGTDERSYLQLKFFLKQYACVEQMAYCNHPFYTQMKKSLNEAIATVAPKNVCYSNSISLYSRVPLVIGIHNLGYEKFFRDLFQELNIAWSNISQYLKRRDEKKERRKNYQ
jgi:hypothetical protein